ncbi:hypothetical protein Pcinc_013384 [Petrolisthes cinctipes]|uniref:Ionotropic glutamate receptor C-terminal domain-containing protein n=1 Tax=Petrolisthes cinctipes TaxID=88211 RepID=A0AAE1FZ67_PETCI|nr:hypothetical protein Pcinc_013384 [Petrolisthes cinctipes]
MDLTDTTLFTYDLTILQHVFASPDHTSSIRYVIVLCSFEHTMEIFTEVRKSSLESRSVRWVVVTEEEVLGLSLSMVLREGTHVGLLVRVEPNLYHIFSSYVDLTNAISNYYNPIVRRPAPNGSFSDNPADLHPSCRDGVASYSNSHTGMLAVLALLHKNRLCTGMLAVQRESVTDFTLPYFLESTTLVSPAPSELPRALAVFYPFSTYLWGLLAVVILLMGPLVFLVSRGHDLSVPVVDPSLHSQQSGIQTPGPELRRENRDLLASVSATCFNVFRTIVIQGNLLPARSWPIRLVLFSWFAFCVILYALYAGTLTAYMTKPSFEPPIDSLEDALEAHRRFGFIPVAQQGTSNLRLWRNAEKGIMKALYDFADPSRFPTSGNQAFKMVMNEKVMYMTPKLNSEVRATQRGRHRFHIARNTFLYQGYGIACRIGSPLTTVFDIMLLRMVQGGLVEKWVQDELDDLRMRVSRENQDAASGGGGGGGVQVAITPLSLDHLQGAFIILLSGGALAAFIFLLESLNSRRSKSSIMYGHEY